MPTTNFEINGKTYAVSIDGCPEFRYGKNAVLAGVNTDIVYSQPWYAEGYTAADFLSVDEFAFLKSGLTASVKKIITEELGFDTHGFTLEKYHHFVRTNEEHYKVVSRTRDLFSADFNFPIEEMIPKFEKILGFSLTDIDPMLKEKLHIIVRINRPKSNDYNPPHKDIYEEVDKNDYIPPFVNFWIPIAGVTENSSLPIVPGSHQISEAEILRTFDGGVVEGNTYRVRMIREWSGSHTLERAAVKDGQVLLFSSHLIHGLAINEEEDLSRVALEFRLFKS
ncbi:phytanoyl-CoA dioxygenase [Lacihabitans sp. CCS-44]|uniref:phytanoyl-CoA dioxygenase family protein n=1 Tax=Lacihabitans sp. CCS-44 TaxID=2487331 RepID=UPI0020CE6FF0|nr:phytanoyl-CoA dioxygenase family protein [Lacihabitans sp. CCS-44]MCP9756283.1 phytanoyl-CoA dioxygenase [Lacihabitans sp. CCS-44]